jgi:hypothetical protein
MGHQKLAGSIKTLGSLAKSALCPGQQFMPAFGLRVGSILYLEPGVSVVFVNAEFPLKKLWHCPGQVAFLESGYLLSREVLCDPLIGVP